MFGNVHRERAGGDSGESGVPAAFNEEIERGVERCRQSCEYYEICLGGAPANKLFENGRFDSTETLFCRLAKKAVIDVVLERMESAFGLAS